jgi:Protoglobin
MKRIAEDQLESDRQYRFGYLADFIGFGHEDVEAVHGAAAGLAPLVPALVDAVYVKLFDYDATKRHFVPPQSGYEGATPENIETLTLDHPLIAFRKQHLGRYLATLVTKPYDEKMVNYLDSVGKIHTPKAGSGDLNVPLVQMNALLGFVSDALTEAIFGMGLERDVEVRTLRAFQKLLWIQNDFITRHYQAA